VSLDVRPACVGQLKRPASLALFRPDQAFILQLLQGRVDRARARAPKPLAPLRQLLHYLVPVQRLLGEERQYRGANVPPANPGSAPPHRRAESPEGESAEGKPCPPSEAPGASTAPAAAHGEPASEPGPGHPTCSVHLANPPCSLEIQSRYIDNLLLPQSEQLKP